MRKEMKKQWIIGGCFLLVGIFTYFVYQNDIRMDQAVKLVELEAGQERLKQFMLQHIQSIEGHVDTNTRLHSLSHKESVLEDVVRDGARVGLYIDRLQCSDCWERALSYMKKVAPTIQHLPKPFVLVGGYNRRDFILLNQTHDIPFPVYLMEHSLPLKHLTSQNQPFYFVLEPGGRLSSVFYPEELYGMMGELYFKTMAGACYREQGPEATVLEPEYIDLLDEEIDFGQISVRKKKKLTFRVKNTGKRKIEIKNVRTSCNCVLLEATPRYILPGETGLFKVIFLSSSKGYFVREVLFNTNQSNTVYKLRMKGRVI